MKAFTWFLLFLLALLFAAGYYFYEYIYIPKKVLITRLSEENLKLKYEMKDELDRLYRDCKSQNTHTTEKNVEHKSLAGNTPDNDTVSSNTIEPVAFAFSIRDLFKGSTLSIKGKALINEFYNQIKGRDFDSIRIVINRRNPSAARKVLNIKKYLIKLGLDKNRVWARLDRKIVKDSVYIKILW